MDTIPVDLNGLTLEELEQRFNQKVKKAKEIHDTSEIWQHHSTIKVHVLFGCNEMVFHNTMLKGYYVDEDGTMVLKLVALGRFDQNSNYPTTTQLEDFGNGR